jgi:acetylornithine/N-succinyldiaminopimelate aminotransferase
MTALMAHTLLICNLTRGLAASKAKLHGHFDRPATGQCSGCNIDDVAIHTLSTVMTSPPPLSSAAFCIVAFCEGRNTLRFTAVNSMDGHPMDAPSTFSHGPAAVSAMATAHHTGPSPAVLPTYARQDLVFERGEGVHLMTSAGVAYLDFAGGVAVSALGHAHPRLIAALTEQAGRVWHTSNLYRIAGQERLAERLTEVTFADRVFFCNSGAEAIECAIKTARRFHHVNGQPERYRLITFEGAFHGRTLATIAASNNKKYLDGFGPKVEGFDSLASFDIDAVKAAITAETAGFLIEPIQGEGGIRVVPHSFLSDLRQLADDHGLLLVMDEIQCGVGRTGKLFAHEWTGITPDIMAIAKGIGAGFPLGACLATEAAARGMTAGTHGSTFGGNPLAMAVGNAVLDEVLAPGFLEAVVAKGLRMKQLLAGLKDAWPDIIDEVRGDGLMLGLKIKPPVGQLVTALLGQHMLSVPAGDNVLRLLPPLIIDDAVMSSALTALDAACRTVSQSQSAAAAGG